MRSSSFWRSMANFLRAPSSSSPRGTPVEHEDAAPGHQEDPGVVPRQRAADLQALIRDGVQPVGARPRPHRARDLPVRVVRVWLGSDRILEYDPVADHQVRQGPFFGLPVAFPDPAHGSPPRAYPAAFHPARILASAAFRDPSTPELRRTPSRRSSENNPSTHSGE
jgi:hypothetical protein